VTTYFTLTTAVAQVCAYVVPVNIHVTPVNTSFYYSQSRGGGAATEVSAVVQFTIDSPFVTSPTPNWFNFTAGADSIIGVTALTFPHSAIRLNVTQVSGSVAIAFGVLNVGM